MFSSYFIYYAEKNFMHSRWKLNMLPRAVDEDTWTFKLVIRRVQNRISYRDRGINNENTDRCIYTSEIRRSRPGLDSLEERRTRQPYTSEIFIRDSNVECLPRAQRSKKFAFYVKI